MRVRVLTGDYENEAKAVHRLTAFGTGRALRRPDAMPRGLLALFLLNFLLFSCVYCEWEDPNEPYSKSKRLVHTEDEFDLWQFLASAQKVVTRVGIVLSLLKAVQKKLGTKRENRNSWELHRAELGSETATRMVRFFSSKAVTSCGKSLKAKWSDGLVVSNTFAFELQITVKETVIKFPRASFSATLCQYKRRAPGEDRPFVLFMAGVTACDLCGLKPATRLLYERLFALPRYEDTAQYLDLVARTTTLDL